MTLTIFPLFYPLYSVGVTPNCFLNTTEKWLCVLKPHLQAISETVNNPLFSSSAARLSL